MHTQKLDYSEGLHAYPTLMCLVTAHLTSVTLWSSVPLAPGGFT